MDVYPLAALVEIAHALSQSPGDYAFWKLRLAQNDVTIDAATVLGDFTEATFPGYAEVLMSHGTWDDDGAGRGRTTYATQTWTCTASGTPNTIYAWYIVDTSFNKLVACQRWIDAPVPINAPGQYLTLVPRITCASEV